jgi:heme/copper-type cytochrome/quinol oxidase subunit 2
MNPTTNQTPDDRWRPRFGLGTMMLVTICFCVMGTAGYHLMRTRGLAGAVGSQTSPQAVFVIFTVAAPVLLLVVLSVGHQVVAWFQRGFRSKDR